MNGAFLVSKVGQLAVKSMGLRGVVGQFLVRGQCS